MGLKPTKTGFLAAVLDAVVAEVVVVVVVVVVVATVGTKGAAGFLRLSSMRWVSTKPSKFCAFPTPFWKLMTVMSPSGPSPSFALSGTSEKGMMLLSSLLSSKGRLSACSNLAACKASKKDSF